MKITFLGTGTSQGVPVIACGCSVCQSVNPKDSRLRTSILIENSGQTIIIDTGPDFRQQMLNAKVKNLDAVVFTHAHKDHTAGLDDIRAFNYVSRSKMNVFATLEVQEQLKREYDYVFAGVYYPGIPEIQLHTIDNNPFKVGETTFIPIEVLHLRLSVFGFRIGNFTYITDANFISDKEMKKIEGTEVLVINALRLQKHVSHFTLEEALQIIKKVHPKQAYLTHISHQLGLHNEVEKILPPNVHCAYDGLTLEI